MLHPYLALFVHRAARLLPPRVSAVLAVGQRFTCSPTAALEIVRRSQSSGRRHLRSSAIRLLCVNQRPLLRGRARLFPPPLLLLGTFRLASCLPSTIQ